MGQFILRSQGNPNSIGKVDQRKEIERTSIGLNFSSRKKSKMSLLTRELAYSLLSHKTSVCVCVPGEITTKNCSLWNPDNVAFPPSQSRHAYTRMSLMTRYVVHISYIFLGNSKSVLVYYQDCAKWDDKLPIENWKWWNWWPSIVSGSLSLLLFRFRFQADRKRWEQIASLGNSSICRRRSCRRKLGGFHSSPDFIFFPTQEIIRVVESHSRKVLF